MRRFPSTTAWTEERILFTHSFMVRRRQSRRCSGKNGPLLGAERELLTTEKPLSAQSVFVSADEDR